MAGIQRRGMKISARDKISRAYIFCGLGGTARLLGKFEESLNFYRKAMEIFQKTSDAEGLAYSFCGLGSAYRIGIYRMGTFPDAVVFKKIQAGISFK